MNHSLFYKVFDDCLAFIKNNCRLVINHQNLFAKYYYSKGIMAFNTNKEIAKAYFGIAGLLGSEPAENRFYGIYL